MVSLDKAVIARYKTHCHNFEVYVDPDKSLDFKGGAELKISEVVAVENVFKDAGAADKASEDVMKEVFGTSDPLKVAEEIIKKGEIHLTTDQRKRILEDRRKQIVTIIARNAINPQTGTPHPPARIDKAMEEARVHVDITKNEKEQVDGVMKAIKPIIPIRFEKVKVALKIPAQYGGKFHKIFTEYGELQKDEWIGSYEYCLVEIPAGVQDEFASRINGMTHGEVEIKVMRNKDGV